MNIAKLMKQAQKMQADAARIQEELASRTYEATAGGGAVKAVSRGDGELLELKIDPQVIKDAADDAGMLEDLILTAIQEACGKAKVEAQAEMGKLTSGLGLPGL